LLSKIIKSGKLVLCQFLILLFFEYIKIANRIEKISIRDSYICSLRKTANHLWFFVAGFHDWSYGVPSDADGLAMDYNAIGGKARSE
jgi:hypothetical protein